MINANIRDLTHHFSDYLREVKSGEHITILERNKPVAEIIPLNSQVSAPGWKRTIKKIKIKGPSLSSTLIKMRRESP